MEGFGHPRTRPSPNSAQTAMKAEEQLQMLVDGLQLLAAPADEQIQALPVFVSVADEVLSTFSDAYLLVDQIRRAGLIEDTAAEALKVVDDFLEQMPEDETIGAPGSLRSHPFWAEARRLASAALVAMGQPAGPGSLRYVRYVE